jgi:uncharacterized damage-inducible protein DinB
MARISELTLTELLYGQGAHANTVACVEDVPLELAGRQAANSPHSIWQLVYHMNFWMAYELSRIRRESPVYPAHASESWPVNAAPSTGEEWQKTIALFRDLLAELARLADSPPDVLADEVNATHPDHTKRSSSLVAVLWQTLVHNSYHIGQVAMLRRTFGAWPPKGGGDSW